MTEETIDAGESLAASTSDASLVRSIARSREIERQIEVDPSKFRVLTGDQRTRMVITGVFQANTELTASEILDKKTKPEQLGKLVARLRHRPLKGAKQANHDGPPPGHPAHGGGGFDEDSIPF